MTKKSSLKDYVAELIEPKINELGYELVDVEYKNPGGIWRLIIYIYKKDGISFEDCELVSRTIDPMLDEDEFVLGRYDFLQVSSPGLDRPIKTLKDFKRYLDNDLEISLFAPINGNKKFEAKLLSATEYTITVNMEGEELSIPTNQIAKANLAIKFN